MQQNNRLYSFDFLAVCLVVFFVYCNVTIFYNFYTYLEEIGIAKQWRGFLIGSSALSTIALFLVASPFLTVGNASRWAAVGAVLLIACGVSYLGIRSVPGVLVLRLAHGAAIYLLTAACMTMMVSGIPAERSGQAFSLYSVALLLPYSIVPAVYDAVAGLLPSQAYGYLGMSLLLVPGLACVGFLGRRLRARQTDGPHLGAKISLLEMYRNAACPSVALILALNALYVMTFTSFFFLAKGLFLSRGYSTVGLYFTIQTCCMIAVRLAGNRLFDRMRKIRLFRVSLLLSAVSFLLAARAGNLTALYGSAVAMGLGMGLSSPALYGLMYCISPPRYKALNSNLMMLSQQLGNFFGPLLGAGIMHATGYSGFLLADAGICLVAIGLSSVLTSRIVDRRGLAAKA